MAVWEIMRIFARFRPSRAYAGGVAGKKRGGANILNLKEIKTKGCREISKAQLINYFLIFNFYSL